MVFDGADLGRSGRCYRHGLSGCGADGCGVEGVSGAAPHSGLPKQPTSGLTTHDFVDRYAVPLGVVVALTLALSLLPGTTTRRVETGTGIESASGPSSVEGAGSTGADLVPGTGGALRGTLRGSSQVASAGGAGQLVVGKGPCRSDGRQLGISKYMPPCLTFTGDNGGSTGRGVSRTQIKVVPYYPERDPGTQAILEGARIADPPEITRRASDALRIYSNHHYETYGREVVFEPVTASGEPQDDEAMKRDAVRIAEEIRPFAVFVGDPVTQIPATLASELAARGVVCICIVTYSSQWYLEHRPYIFGSLPTFNEYGAQIAEFIGKRLVGPGRTAKWAGDVSMRSLPRRFGLINIVGSFGKVDPEGKRAHDILLSEVANWGVTSCPNRQAGNCLAAESEYLYEEGRNQNDVDNLIAQMVAAGVTTIIPIVDPLYPIFITRAATNHGYFPEWLITGTGLSDTTAAGRLYDQSQWRNAFGISPLSIIPWVDVRRSTGYREFYHGRPDIQPGSCQPARCEGVLINVYRAYIASLFRGIHMAGPRLTADTFAQGMFNYPPTGGSPASPLIFVTRESPNDIKDFTEVFYAADQRGFDERGEDGFGMILKVDIGRRYRVGQWPTSDPKAFDLNNAMAASDNPPGGGDPTHEQDGHKHSGSCRSCL